MERATVVVALPAVDEDVYDVSSEKVPHMTLLYLGDVDLSAEAVLYIEHACKELSPFWMYVDYRDTLGEDDADVLFFEKNEKRINEFRHHLLLNDEIKKAFDAAPQHTDYPEWTPHLTLGYPEAPAKDDEDKRMKMIDFDRIAVWTGDFEGPEFRLKYAEYADQPMAMSTEEKGAYAASTIFGHDPNAAKQYGVKGMRWGITTKDRAAQRTPTPVSVNQKVPGKFAKAAGGKNQPLHEDAVRALEARQKAKSSTTDSLSNKELQTAINRMQLEQRYSQLSLQSDRRSRGMRFVFGFFGKRKSDFKFKDMDEEVGAQSRRAVKTAIEGYKVAKAVAG